MQNSRLVEIPAGRCRHGVIEGSFCEDCRYFARADRRLLWMIVAGIAAFAIGLAIYAFQPSSDVKFYAPGGSQTDGLYVHGAEGTGTINADSIYINGHAVSDANIGGSGTVAIEGHDLFSDVEQPPAVKFTDKELTTDSAARHGLISPDNYRCAEPEHLYMNGIAIATMDGDPFCAPPLERRHLSN